jgi:mono/diheme cytochrome c family protein
MSMSRTGAHLCAAITWICLTFVAGAVRVATQTPAGSDGWHIPEGAATEVNPKPITPALIAKGQSLYRAKCQRCHGVDGTGHGQDADPDHPPGNLTDARRASRNPDGVMFTKSEWPRSRRCRP